MIAKIAVSAATFAIDKPYSYRVPEGMSPEPGMRVTVPFGRSNRRCEGVVLELADEQGEGFKLIEAVLDEAPVLTLLQLRLAGFMRERYFCTLYDAVRAMLPAGLWFKSHDRYTLTDDRSWQTAQVRQKDAIALLECLKDTGGSTDGSVLRQCVADDERFEKAVSYLQRKKWLTAERSYARKIGDKTEKIASLAVPAEEVMTYMTLRPTLGVQQRAVLELLCGLGSAAVKDICYFTGASTATVKRLVQLGLLELSERQLLRCRHIVPAQLDGPLVLNEEQQQAYEGLAAQLCSREPGTALLYGVTGSGKTSVYIRLIAHCLSEQRQALLLVPEIALTPQLLGLMAAHFGDKVAVLHSNLPAGERYDQWKRIRSGEASVVIGTRSAVFAPCPTLGLIILDEEQEHSYKSENAPRYSAKEVATWRGMREHALVLLGSATPSVESMYRAKQGHYTLYQLRRRYNGKPLPKVEIVDMRQELKLGNDSAMSYPLQDALRRTADSGKQTVLFLNRRGNSRALVCVDCRQAPECPRCSARLTYHSANERLMCHYCGHSQPVMRRCPACGGPLKPVGTGTQRVQQELAGAFADLAVDRMDADTVSAANPHEKILDHFKNEHVPVLLGTQMVAKGLNLPDVTLVGVLDADLSLYTGGYRAAETTFNMLTQVVGRAGRGEQEGRAIIQTLVPEHPVITMAAAQDYDSFYELELNLRRVQNCPPFGDIVTVTFVGQLEERVLAGAVKFKDSLLYCLAQPDYRQERCTPLGPAPCPVAKINCQYRYRLTLRCTMSRSLGLLLGHLLRQSTQDKLLRGVTVFIDVNGYD